MAPWDIPHFDDVTLDLFEGYATGLTQIRTQRERVEGIQERWRQRSQYWKERQERLAKIAGV